MDNWTEEEAAELVSKGWARWEGTRLVLIGAGVGLHPAGSTTGRAVLSPAERVRQDLAARVAPDIEAVAGLLRSYECVRRDLESLSRSPDRIFHAGGVLRLRKPRRGGYCDDLDCTHCDRVVVARYECTCCRARIDVPGKFEWSWQGKGHWHRADDEGQMSRHITEHLVGDCAGAVFLPVTRDDAG